MREMFCFQCEQTAGCTGCTGKAGVCGKTAEVSALQDALTGALIGLARAVDGNEPAESTGRIMMEGLFATLTNVNFDQEYLNQMLEQVNREKEKLVPQCRECASPCARNKDYDMNHLWNAPEDIRSLKSLILFGLRGMAAYAYHGAVLGYRDKEVEEFFYEGMFAVGEDLDMDQLLPLVLRVGEVNLKCMALLDKANTQTFGDPQPVQVSRNLEAGPFIVVSGHDLKDLEQVLIQTQGKGIHVYTHGEMLPAHAYPQLKRFPHLKGNFGTAWQNQQKEFAHLPGAVLFTTNCLMPPKESYKDRVFTTGVVSCPGAVHIGEDKDFTPVINRALELGGYTDPVVMKERDQGSCLIGFGHHAILANAQQVAEAVKAGDIRHFFLVGGCDGARSGRNYYREFVKKTPEDTIILTLGCGKYRFNDLDLGSIGAFPRLMDMGQCNDAYGAIQVAAALAEVFQCGINDLPLTLVLSWYEQKAVCILLSLLHLGVKNIYLGPTLPAFVSKNVLGYLVEHYGITPVGSPEEDLKKILTK